MLPVLAPLLELLRCAAAVVIVLIVALVPLFCKLVKRLSTSLDQRVTEGDHLGVQPPPPVPLF